MVPDGVKSPAQNTFRDHDWVGLQALLKPVSQVRILPGALRVFAVQGHFKLLGATWAPDVNDPAGRDLLADVAALGPGWGCIIVRIERQPGAGDGGRPSE